MSEAIIDNLISQETIDSFPKLTKNVDDAITSLEKLIASGVELNQKFAGVKVINELVKATAALEQSQADLDAANKKAADAQKKLSDAQAKNTEEMKRQSQANSDNAKTVAENARAMAQSSSDATDLHRALAEVTVQLKNSRDEQKRLSDARKQGVITEEEYIAALAELSATQTTLKNASSELVTATKNLEKSQAAAGGSINKLEADLKLAQQAYKALSDEEKKTEIGKVIQREIGLLSEELNKQKKSIGDFSSNVGRYAESLGGLFSTVTDEIKTLKTKGEELKTTFQNLTPQQQKGDIGFKLGGQINALANNINQLEKIEKIGTNTNLSYTQSIRQIQKEFINVATSGTQSIGFIQNFKNELGQAVDKQNDLKAEIKLAASDTKSFDLLRSGVNGLVGAYQTGIGVVSLFGDATEDTQKTIAKLVAVQSVANGIQEIGQQLTEHNTAAYRALAYVQGLYKKAVDSSAIATERLGAAFKLIGIGLIIAAVAYLIINFDKLFGSAQKMAKAIDGLTGVSKETKDALKGMGDTIQKIAQTSIKNLEDAIKDINKELGNTPTAIDIATASLKTLKDESQKLEKQLSKNTVAVKGANEELASFGRDITVTKQLEKNNELYSKQADLVTKLVYAQEQLAFAQQDTAIFNKAQQDLKDQQDANTRILALQKTGLEDRLKLTASNFDKEKAIIDAAHKRETAEAQGDLAKEITANAKQKHDLLIAERNFQDETDKIKKEYRERDLKAQSEVYQRSLEQRIEFNKKAADDESQLPEIRLKGLINSLASELLLLQEQQKRELAIEGQTKEEKKNINDKYDGLRVKAEEETGKKIFDIQVKYFAKTEHEQGLLLKHITDGLKQYAIDVYNTTQKIGQDIKQADFMKQVSDGVTEANKNIKGEFDKFGKLLDGLFGGRTANQTIEEYTQGIKDLETNIKSLGSEIEGGIFDLQTNALERQKNAIQEQINLIDEKRDKEIAAIEASGRSEKDKADAIAVINATAEAKKREQERRQKEIDRKKATIEKQQSIARIIQSTAEAVLAALGEKPYKATNIANAAIIGAIGLAQIARVIATPIPAYAEGIDNHPGGPAVVGDAGRSELVVTPQGKLMETPALPTVMNIPAGSVVHPDAKDALANYYGGMTVQKFNSLGNNNTEVVDELKKLNKGIRSLPKTSIVRKGNNWNFITNNEGNVQKWIEQNIS